MWNWIKSLLFKEVVYGVIDSSLQKKNWLGFILTEIDNSGIGFLITIEYDMLTIGIGKNVRTWKMPFGLGYKERTLSIDIFSSGTIYYSVDSNIIMLYTVFWKVIYLKNEYFIDSTDMRICIKDMSLNSRLKYFKGKETTGRIVCLKRDVNSISESIHDVKIIYTNTVWGRGDGRLTRFIMDKFFSGIVVSRLHLDIDNFNTTVIGINSLKELSFYEMLQEV